MSAYKHPPSLALADFAVSRCIRHLFTNYLPIGSIAPGRAKYESINEVCVMGVFRSQTPRACFCLTQSDYFSDSRLDLWAYPLFLSARIRAAFSMTHSRLSTVLSSHPASHIRVLSSAFVSSTSANTLFIFCICMLSIS